MALPLVSIITPVYNGEQYLSEAIESALAQTYKNFELLIINDGSTDKTKELVNRWLNERQIAIEYHFKENGGKHTAMQLGYKNIRTKYFIAVETETAGPSFFMVNFDQLEVIKALARADLVAITTQDDYDDVVDLTK